MDIIKQDMTYIWAVSGDITSPSNTKIEEGWAVEAVPRQWWNWMQNRADSNIAYMLQKGLPEWDATTEFLANKSYVQRSGVVYKALLTGTNKDPVSEPTYWVKAFQDYTAASNALGSLTGAAGEVPYFTNGTTAATTPSTAFGRGILNTADAAAARSYISAQQADATLTAIANASTGANILHYFTGTDTVATTTLSAFGRTLIDDADAAAARTTLGAQPLDATLTTLAALATTSDRLPYFTATDTAALTVFTAFARTLLDDSTATDARNTLGLGTAATATLTTSTTDSTTGRVLRVGDFGLASGDAINTNGTDLNTLTDTGVYTVSNPTNGPAGSNTVTMFVQGNDLSTGRTVQLAHAVNTEAHYIRSNNSGTWSAWKQLFHTGNVSAFVQTIFDDADAAAVRSTLNLGTAATATLTTSVTDANVGRVVRIGDYGIGSTLPFLVSPNLSTDINTGNYYCTTPTNGPVAGQDGYLSVYKASSAYFKQTFTLAGTADQIYERVAINTIWQPWRLAYSQGNVVGTVSQVSGVPTGAVIETGSNSNGRYTKYADGTMIAFATPTNGFSASGSYLTGLSYYTRTITLPVTFVGSYAVTVSGADDSSSGWASWATLTQSTGNVYYYSRNSAPSTIATHYIALGRWF